MEGCGLQEKGFAALVWGRVWCQHGWDGRGPEVCVHVAQAYVSGSRVGRACWRVAREYDKEAGRWERWQRARQRSRSVEKVAARNGTCARAYRLFRRLACALEFCGEFK
jgi:hypothetical protein